uniref:Uncharacterized protein n=1 Tax=Anguilla anguilla TaxID=7936 RepID=A0A0E9VK15_ANGAN
MRSTELIDSVNMFLSTHYQNNTAGLNRAVTNINYYPDIWNRGLSPQFINVETK